MPITPFHLIAGAGLWSKRDAFWGFFTANVIIDTEVLWRVAADETYLHATFHTLVFALFLIVCSLKPLNWWTAGVAIGGVSHVLLDSIMHVDVKPFAPFTDWSPLYGLMSGQAVGWLCAIIGLLGIPALLVDRSKRLQDRGGAS